MPDQRPPTRVLIVDGSPFLRIGLKRLLSSAEGIEVVGEAGSTPEALTILRSQQPVDVVLLDVIMPHGSAAEAVRLIFEFRSLPIILFTAAEEKAPEVREALKAGAVSYIQKPGRDERCPLLIQARGQLIDQILMARTKQILVTHPKATPATISKFVPHLVLVGVSTGGPSAIGKILSDLPRNFSPCMLIVQHISDGHTTGLAQHLQKSCLLPVKEAAANQLVTPGTILLAPSGYHLEIAAGGSMALSNRPPHNGFKPSIDVLFESAAVHRNLRILGVLLTGMSGEGVEGCRALRENRHRVIAQDKESAAVWGMAGDAVQAGLVDETLSLDEITRRLAGYCGAPAAKDRSGRGGG